MAAAQAASLSGTVNISTLTMLAIAVGRPQEAKRWAALGYEGFVDRAPRWKSNTKTWPHAPGPGESGRSTAGIFVVDCSKAPLLRRISSAEPVAEREAALIRECLGYASGFHTPTINDFLGNPQRYFATELYSNVATRALYEDLYVPALAVGDKELIKKCEKWSAQFREAHRGAPRPEPGPRRLFEFHYFDPLFTAFVDADAKAFAAAMAGQWKASYIAAWEPRSYVGRLDLVVLSLVFYEQTGKALELNLDPPLGGFSPATFSKA